MRCDVSGRFAGRHALRIGALLGASLLLTGCGSSAPMAPVRGTVTLDGEPLAITPPRGSGTVTFVPTSADQPYAYGDIGQDGTFMMKTPDVGDGAVLGSYRVMISAGEMDSDDIEANMVILTPRKYGSDATSGLTADVKEGENVIDFALESGGKKGGR